MAQTLLANPALIHVECVRPRGDLITLIVRMISPHCPCPSCRRPSRVIHSRYARRVADLPWQGVSVLPELHARRFRCPNSLCPRGIFCERLPSVVAPYARRTVRLHAALELIGFAVGGEAGGVILVVRSATFT